MLNIYAKYNELCIFDYNSIVNIEFLRNPLGGHVYPNTQNNCIQY